MEKFKYLTHTADAKFVAKGRTHENVFMNSAYAMFNLLTDIKRVRGKTSVKIFLKSKTIENLLIDFLNELLFLLEVKNFVPAMKGHTIKITLRPGEAEIKGRIKGDNIKKYEHHGHIKSATYNEFSFKKIPRAYRAQIVVDI
ncbi:archease [Candidatus Peregrinibacteria bacterium]|nr:archease [Candidatus Peregrinibacteria bacterium]